MGTDTGDASPKHEVTLASFKIARSEVTFGQYKKCVDEGFCSEPLYLDNGQWTDPDKENIPAFGVSWAQARAYCQWAGSSLPSEAQWEYAARSEGQTFTYPWGNEPADCDHVVAVGCSPTGSAMDVCSKPAGNTVQGLCDMAGNVAEWTEDLYWYNYVGAPIDGSPRLDTPRLSQDRVVRGGDYMTSMSEVLGYLATTRRDSHGPLAQSSTIGFRCVR